jgi:excisionase family DNA binding protein
VNDPIPAGHSADKAAGPAEDPRDSGPRAARRGQGPMALYNTDEAAAILRVKKSWLERQAAGRKIPFTMLGGAYRFTGAHLAAIVRMYEMMPSPSGDARDSRSRSRRARELAAPVSSGVAPLRPRPRSRRHEGGNTGPSAA